MFIRKVPANKIAEERDQFIKDFRNHSVIQLAGIPIGMGSAYLVTAVLFTSVNPVGAAVLFLGYETFCKVVKLTTYLLCLGNSKVFERLNTMLFPVRVIAGGVAGRYTLGFFNLKSIGMGNSAGILIGADLLKTFVIYATATIFSRICVRPMGRAEYQTLLDSKI